MEKIKPFPLKLNDIISNPFTPTVPPYHNGYFPNENNKKTIVTCTMRPQEYSITRIMNKPSRDQLKGSELSSDFTPFILVLSFS